MCLSVTTLVVALRIYSKLFVVKKIAKDDYATLIAFAAVVVYASLTISYEKTGYGSHEWDLTFASFSNQQQLIVVVNNCLYGPVIFAVKASGFLLFYCVFGSLRWMRLSVFTGLAVTGVWYLSNIVVFAVLCSPRSGQSYVEAASSPRCHRNETYGLVNSGFNIVSNFYLLILPIPAVMGLQMPTKRKFGVLAVFGTGLAACITSCVAFWTQIRLNISHDGTWMATPAFISAIVDLNVSLWAGSMPALTGLIRIQSFGLGALLDKILHGISSLSALLYLHSSKANKDASVLRGNPTPTLNRDLLGRPQEQYIELQDHHELMHDAWHSQLIDQN